jgi:pimeloyl-ACP methyl ester carboxylesterase
MRPFVIGIAVILVSSLPVARGQRAGGPQPSAETPTVLAPTPAEIARTAAFVAGFQSDDGGFSSLAGGASTLGSTSSAIRALKYTGGSIHNVPTCIEFVKKCRDAASGGFAQTPGGKPDVSATAIGLMAFAELKAADDVSTQAAIGYFSKNVNTFEDIRIAVAGLEAAKVKSPDFPAWIKQVESDRNSDGTWGQGAGQARATGSAAVALLRMGVELDKKDAILAAMRAGQRPDGGWSDGEKPSDLGSSYRIMRCLYMLNEKPDLDRLFSYIALHRQPDGGYAPGTSKPSDIGSTYFSTIMIRWGRLLGGEPALVETAGFKPLFNGQDLAGWEGSGLWSARSGMVVGRSLGIRQNDFLATQDTYGDFVLKLSFRLLGDESSNSGIQIRSVRIPGTEMSGYQADVGQEYWGCLYDESRRNKVLARASAEAGAAVHKAEWNQYVIRAMGDHITLTLNGVKTVDYTETDPNIPQHGKIALQIHAGKSLEVQFKDIYIQPLPRPTSDASLAPGFHLRAVKTPKGERKYTVFLPDGYEPINSSGVYHGYMPQMFIVILFLHGAGERGTDGITPAQVGLGPAIAANPAKLFANPARPPCLAIFPQAENTWSADSDDAATALAALDDVLKRIGGDKNRVVLTGLSMGGHGAWEIAAAHPEKFAAVVPICGAAKPDVASKLKDLPVWSFVGDDDGDRTVLGMRELIGLLPESSAERSATEYRGVGHNSWDRAYSDSELIQWILSQTKVKGGFR